MSDKEEKPKKKAAKKICIDSETCIGCGACEVTAPEYFELGNEGFAKPKRDFDEADKDIINEAIEGCPANAITLKDNDSEAKE